MFKWLAKQFNTDEDLDSLGSEKGLEAFIAGLPLTLPASTVEGISEQFEHASALELTPEQLRRALKRLDERAQEPLLALGEHLFEDDLGRQLSDSTWLTLARFHRNRHSGYRVCLQALQSRQERSEANRHDAVLIACRAMAALGRYKTLLRMRYRDVDPAYWGHVMELASWSHGAGSSGTLVEPYPGAGYQTSFEREYLTALLFEAAPVPNLLPAQMLALDLILRRFAGSYQFSDTYRDATPYVLDLEREPVAKRWLKGLNARPGLRFFGVAAAYSQLAALHKQANSSQEVPDWLGPARMDAATYRGLLDLLVRHWSVEPPQRQQRRNRAEGEVLIAHGVGQVRRMIAASEYAKAGKLLNYEENTPYDFKLFGKLRFGSVAEQAAQADVQASSPIDALRKFELEGDRQMTERWTLSDVSESGLGAAAQAHGGWARVGMLIGFRHADSLDWRSAVVQRLSRSSKGRLSIGLRMIPASAHCARLRFGNGEATQTWVGVSDAGESYHDAVLLHGERTPSLLLEPGVFTAPTECMISFEKRWRPVKLERILERGYDFDRVEISLTP